MTRSARVGECASEPKAGLPICGGGVGVSEPMVGRPVRGGDDGASEPMATCVGGNVGELEVVEGGSQTSPRCGWWIVEIIPVVIELKVYLVSLGGLDGECAGKMVQHRF